VGYLIGHIKNIIYVQTTILLYIHVNCQKSLVTLVITKNQSYFLHLVGL